MEKFSLLNVSFIHLSYMGQFAQVLNMFESTQKDAGEVLRVLLCFPIFLPTTQLCLAFNCKNPGGAKSSSLGFDLLLVLIVEQLGLLGCLPLTAFR